MKTKTALFVFILAVHIIAKTSAQTTPSLKARCFNWSTPQEGLYTNVGFWGIYKSIIISEPNAHEMPAESYLFKLEKGVYVKIKNQEMFNSQLNILMTKINSQIQKDFKEASMEEYNKECYKDFELDTYTMDNLELSFSDKEIDVCYYIGLWTGCGYNSRTCMSFTWNDILPYLKNPTPKTPTIVPLRGPK